MTFYDITSFDWVDFSEKKNIGPTITTCLKAAFSVSMVLKAFEEFVRACRRPVTGNNTYRPTPGAAATACRIQTHRIAAEILRSPLHSELPSSSKTGGRYLDVHIHLKKKSYTVHLISFTDAKI